MIPGNRLRGLPDPSALRIFVDFPWDSSAFMGTGAYSETMVRALAKAASGSTITLLAPLGSPRRVLLPNVRYAFLPATEGIAEGTRQISLPAFLDAVKADCLFAPASLVPTVKVCPIVATVHDLTFETHPDFYAPSLAGYLRRWFPTTLTAADRIVAISESVRQDLLFRKRVDPGKVAVIEQPIRDTFQEALSGDEVENELRALGVSAPFFFHVSNLSLHKNTEFVVRVFAEFIKRRPESCHHLLFAGGGYGPSAPPNVVTLARELGIGGRVRYVGRVPDRTLKALYQRCDAFLFPSLAEGWGLPVVEARTMGARVLASPHVPSALPSERIPLEETRWIQSLDGSRGDGQAAACGPNADDAGKQLLETITEAIAVYRQSASSKPPAIDIGNPSRATPVVAIMGDWHSPSGLGQAARGVYQALETSGVVPVAVATPKDAIQDKRLWRGEVTLRQDPADLWIHHLPPEHIDLDLPGKHATMFFWETDRLPDRVSGCEWPNVLSRLDEIWTPSTFVSEVLKRSGVTAPVHPIFPPVDTELFSPGARRLPPVELPTSFDPSWTVFLYVGTWDPRKRPDVLVRSFSRAFSSRDNALLLLKSYVTGDAAQDRQILTDWVSQCRLGDAQVRIIPEVLSSEQMAELFRFSTAFTTASRGEGYCLPAIQAMSAGKPVVAADWSAFRDYATISVRHRLEQIPREVSLPGYSPDQRWAVVDEEDLCTKLRWVHEHRDQARVLGLRSRDWVVQNASLTVAGQKLRERIHSLCGKDSPHIALEVAR